MSENRTTINVDVQTSDYLTQAAKHFNTSKADLLRQIADALATSSNVLNLISKNTTLNISNIVEQGIEAEQVKANRVANNNAYAKFVAEQAAQQPKMSLTKAIQSNIRKVSTWSELVELCTTAYPHLEANFANPKPASAPVLQTRFFYENALIIRATGNAYNVRSNGEIEQV